MSHDRTRPSKALGAFIALSYGPIIAATYVLLKKVGNGRPDLLLALSSLVSAAAIAGIFPKASFKALISRPILLRSVCFAGAQVLLVASLRSAEVSGALVAAMAGTVVAYVSHWFLRRKTQAPSWFGWLISICGTILAVTSIRMAALPIMAGILQGFSFFLLKGITRTNIQPIATQFPIFLITGLLGALFNVPSGITMPGVVAVAGVGFVLIIVQLYAYWINKVFAGTTASIIGGSRVPASLAIDHFFIGAHVSLNFFFGALLVLFGFALETFHQKRLAANAEAP